MPGLILEGGTFRPIFSAGVMDALLDYGIMFPYCIGVSAGISNGFSYISKQKERNLKILINHRNDKRYISRRNFIKCRSLFGLDFIYDEIPNKLYPFDWNTFRNHKGEVLVGVTNARTGKSEYLNGLTTDTPFTMLRATCAIPLFFPAIEWQNEKYYDGGLADPIPIQKSIADGNEKNLIVLTRPSDYRKEYGRENDLVIRLIRRKYPELEKIIKNRHQVYNDTIAFCEELERAGKAIIIRPEYPLNSFEKNTEVIQKNYQSGYNLAVREMERIKQLF
ncbi:patatin family protein [Anaerocolumna cellulosilytica]|uniref:Patatin family protein n=1 Tax=Anaerocolumna cellulosilytica TaxID=433286 RepID=A0A6S6QZZ4_9FIRM|nr:patatin family protein [Anaerocolumna cellulosilytica]MBB5194169.1 putative patatin/cPLA2 family phospholipase [Anaerocolumna cellulosilytica]BCJ94619.1 patatin family protein [Anaerocolumna cellulosilytica]